MNRKLLTTSLLLCSMLLSGCPSKNDIEGQSQETLPKEFSLETANTVPPDHIAVLKEIKYFGAPAYSSPCEHDSFSEPAFLYPTIVEDPQDTELMRPGQMGTCGWTIGEELTGNITYPDGRTKTEVLIAEEYYDTGEAILEFRPSINDPEGIYTFEISNGLTSLESNAYFSYPDGPRLYELDDQQLVFIGFPANEKLRLFMYAPEATADWEEEQTWKLAAWQEIKVDENGYLLLNAPVRENSFVAITASGDEYATDRIGLIQTDWISKLKWNLELMRLGKEESGCQSELQSQVPEAVRQVKIVSSGLVLYSQPRTTARVVTTLQRNQIVDIKGPICIGDAVWWQMSIDNDYEMLALSGYALETGNEIFSVEAIK